MIVKAKKCFKVCKWSTWLPIILYFIFITTILCIAFPQKSTHIFSIAAHDKATEKINMQKFQSERHKEIPETVILADPKSDGSNLLKYAFKKADVNSDGSLTLQELAHYINQKVSDHIDTSIKQNSQIFAEVDKNPVDGLISWEEYHQYFLRKIGLDEKYVKTHNENKHIKLDRKSKEILMKDKALWSEVARTDPYSLTLDEFLAFQHPEASTTNLLNLVDDILRHFDVDGDDQLTIEEFTSTHSTNNENKKFFITHDVTERKAEFKRFIDKNYDGKADRGELLTYVDPRHPRHSVLEATTLFNFSDVNKDMVLSLEEVLSHTQLFISSKMISTMENFHDEF